MKSSVACFLSFKDMHIRLLLKNTGSKYRS